MHAEIRIGDSPIMLMDAMMGGKGPKAFGGSPASLWLYVDDCDALFNRAVAAGGKVRRTAQMTDQFWGDAPARSPIPRVHLEASRRTRKTSRRRR